MVQGGEGADPPQRSRAKGRLIKPGSIPGKAMGGSERAGSERAEEGGDLSLPGKYKFVVNKGGSGRARSPRGPELPGSGRARRGAWQRGPRAAGADAVTDGAEAGGAPR